MRTDERGPSPSSERESKIYHLAVPVLKSTPNLVISRRNWAETAKKCTKSVMHVQSCYFAHKNYFVLGPVYMEVGDPRYVR